MPPSPGYESYSFTFFNSAFIFYNFALCIRSKTFLVNSRVFTFLKRFIFKKYFILCLCVVSASVLKSQWHQLLLELVSSGRTASVFNHWVISLAISIVFSVNNHAICKLGFFWLLHFHIFNHFYVFSCLIDIAKTSSTIANKRAVSGYFCLIPDFRGNFLFVFIIIDCRFVVYGLQYFEVCSIYS